MSTSKRPLRHTPWLLLLCCLLFCLTAQAPLAHEVDQAVLRFGIFPYESPRAVVQIFGPLAKRIEARTGRRVKLVSAQDEKQFIERGQQGEYDLALPCVTCAFLMAPSGYHVIARGEPDFFGCAITRADSRIKAVAEVKGARIGAIHTRAYAGYLFFTEEMRAAGLDPSRDAEFSFLGKQTDSIILGVVNKHFDVGIVRLDTLENKAFDQMRGQVRIIAQSPAIPQFPFVVRDSLDADLVKLITEVLVGLDPARPEDAGILKSMRVRSIIAASDADYEEFRRHINALKDWNF